MQFDIIEYIAKNQTTPESAHINMIYIRLEHTEFTLSLHD